MRPRYRRGVHHDRGNRRPLGHDRDHQDRPVRRVHGRHHGDQLRGTASVPGSGASPYLLGSVHQLQDGNRRNADPDHPDGEPGHHDASAGHQHRHVHPDVAAGAGHQSSKRTGY